VKHSLTTLEFAQMMEEIAPLQAACEWDNSGLVLDLGIAVKKILVCLDVTNAVIDEAAAGGFDTIVSHHPPVFAPARQFSIADPTGRRLIRSIQCGLNLYAAHTSYDAAPDSGMSMVLGRQIGLYDLSPLQIEKRALDGSVIGAIGAIGHLQSPMSVNAFAEHIKKVLGVPCLRAAGSRASIFTVACMGGAAGEYIHAAAEHGADAFLVGEVKHHHYEQANSIGIVLFEAGHYDTEAVFVQEVCHDLQKRADALEYAIEICGSVASGRPYVVM